jgi:hypothetical protein
VPVSTTNDIPGHRTLRHIGLARGVTETPAYRAAVAVERR